MEDIGKQIEAMTKELGTAEDMEQRAGLLNRLAGALGSGFLKGELPYSRMQGIKETVERIETERREFFAREAAPKRTVHSR